MGSQTSKIDSYSEVCCYRERFACFVFPTISQRHSAKQIGGTCDEESGCLLPAQQHYRNPHQRRQLRKRGEVLAEPPDPRIDPTADKYDYLIVFKKVPQSRRVNIDSATGAFNVPKQVWNKHTFASSKTSVLNTLFYFLLLLEFGRRSGKC
jgi:hypothetical protein